MKKLMVVLMSMCLMAATMLTGCGAPEPEEKSTKKSGSGVAGEVFEGDPSEYKVALMIPGQLGDKSFFDASYEAVGLLEKEYGMEVDYVECGTDVSKYYPAYVDLCEGGYDLILTVSSNGDDALVQAAEEYPDQKFINLDDTMEEIPDNVYIMAPKNNEMSFLAGAVAARKAKELDESVVGFIGGMDIPGINEFLVGYIEGVHEIDPEMKVATSYVGSFTDTAKGKENALLLYDSGLSVIFAAAGQSGLGVIDAAAQTGNFVIGVDSDQAASLKESQPELANVIITSAVKNIQGSALNVVQREMEGKVAFGTRELFGIKDNAVGLAENEFYNKLMSEEQKTKVEELKTKIMNGELEVTDTSGLTTEELVEIREQARP